jgi:hypothetical protein
MTQLAGSMANDEVVNVELLGSIELKSLSEVVIEDKLRKLAAEQALVQTSQPLKHKRDRERCVSMLWAGVDVARKAPVMSLAAFAWTLTSSFNWFNQVTVHGLPVCTTLRVPW